MVFAKSLASWPPRQARWCDGGTPTTAAAKVLADATEPLSAGEMVERMLARGLWQTNGKTPASTIYAAILREIKNKGEKARFSKVARGKFELAR